MKHGHSVVFVYGTLLSGMGNSYLLDKAEHLGPAKVPGLLYASGIPFAKYGGTLEPDTIPFIEGELYKVDEVTLARLDRLESYTPGKKADPNWYDRIEIDQKDGMPVYMYHVEEPPRYAEHIPSGSYRRYRNEQLPQAVRSGS